MGICARIEDIPTRQDKVLKLLADEKAAFLRRTLDTNPVFAYRFGQYWQDVGTLDSYYESNLAFLSERPPLDLGNPDWVIHTQSADRPPVRFESGGNIRRSLIANGCRVAGASPWDPRIDLPPSEWRSAFTTETRSAPEKSFATDGHR